MHTVVQLGQQYYESYYFSATCVFFYELVINK